LAGSQTADRVVLTIGKFAVPDIFDTNRYAHDPRSDFFNWSIIEAGSFDYAADAWGYTYGAAAEWYQDWWTIRSGLFNLSKTPNSKALDTMVYNQATQIALETGSSADIAAVRKSHNRSGVSLNLEQQITEDVGAFARSGWAQGRYEAFDFTDINQTVSLGVSVRGRLWDRPDDTFGLALARNDASNAARRFFAAGGLGILVGDGKLFRSGAELIAETYYSIAVYEKAKVSIDYQFINSPAYNRDRGPVSVFGFRVHAEF
jgi:high affinity Mn2+ porin